MDKDKKGHTVFVVAGLEARILNDRVRKILTLGSDELRIISVTPDKKNQQAEHVAVRPYPDVLGLPRRLGMQKITTMLGKYLYFPSRDILYSASAERCLAKRIQPLLASGCDVTVLTCLPPHAIGLVGLRLKQKFPEINWIIDWQDLWSHDENYFNRLPGAYRERGLRLERDFLRKADINITTNNYARRVLEEEYNVPSERVLAIHHHFSSEDTLPGTGDVDRVERQKSGVTIGFLGNIFKPPRVPGKDIIRAVQKVRQRGVQVELHVFGDISRKEKSYEGVVFHPRRPHKESLGPLAKCDLLLVALADLENSRAVMSIKLPHYMAVGRPIVAIVPDPSAVADIVRDTQTGVVIPSQSDWAEGLERVVAAYTGGNLPQRNDSAISMFCWENVGKQWLGILSGAGEDSVCKQGIALT